MGLHSLILLQDINRFLKNYDHERSQINTRIKYEIESEIEALITDRNSLQELFNRLNKEESNKLTSTIDKLEQKLSHLREQKPNLWVEAFHLVQYFYTKYRKTKLENNFKRIVEKNTESVTQNLTDTERRLSDYETNKTQFINNRNSAELGKLNSTKRLIDGMYALIAGAVGESKVVDELTKLSENHVLINDYAVDFEKPLYNKKLKQRIHSIQIDHLLITSAGIFIIETKNWSQKSIHSYSMRSPIQQVRRTSYALFVLLNSESSESRFRLKKHHWDVRSNIPIRSLVVMINNKPKEKFKYVEVKQLKELNSYIKYFDPIFEPDEVSRITDYFRHFKSMINSPP